MGFSQWVGGEGCRVGQADRGEDFKTPDRPIYLDRVDDPVLPQEDVELPPVLGPAPARRPVADMQVDSHTGLLYAVVLELVVESSLPDPEGFGGLFPVSPGGFQSIPDSGFLDFCHGAGS